MKKILMAAILFFPLLAFIAGCAEEDDVDYLAGSQRVIPESSYNVTFAGTTWPDVVFPHKEHSDRYAGVCATCHFCQDIQNETEWYCRSCHNSGNSEGRCTLVDDVGHGCTYVQCYSCHETDGHNPGQDCGDCHY